MPHYKKNIPVCFIYLPAKDEIEWESRKKNNVATVPIEGCAEEQSRSKINNYFLLLHLKIINVEQSFEWARTTQHVLKSFYSNYKAKVAQSRKLAVTNGGSSDRRSGDRHPLVKFFFDFFLGRNEKRGVLAPRIRFENRFSIVIATPSLIFWIRPS